MSTKKVSGSTTTVYIFSGSKVIAEYDNGAAVTSPSREYIYAGSQLVAKIEAGATNYFHPDHLSTRANTDSSGNVSRTFGQYPFGEVWYETGTANKFKFTTYERDAESGNDYAMARSYINRYARFSSTDPLSGSIGDPQSLNRYSYTRNDPINMVDPFGMTWQCSSSSILGRPQGPGTCVWVPDVDASGNPINYTPGGGSGGRVQTIIRCTFGFSIGTGNTICNDPNGGLGWLEKIKEVINGALHQPRLSECLHKWIGPGAVLTNANLPYLDARQSIAQLTNSMPHAPGEEITGTIVEPVPPTGRGTAVVAGDQLTNLEQGERTYLHETANILATQQFTNSGVAPENRAFLGARGGPPDVFQRKNLDTDIGRQFEDCVFPPAADTTVVVHP